MSREGEHVSKRLGFAALSAGMALTLAACGGEGAGGSGGAGAGGEGAEDLTIGGSMPTQTLERWIAGGKNVNEELEGEGYNVGLPYAKDDIPTHSQQTDQIITEGANILAVAAIDATALPAQWENAASNNTPVVSYDRLIRDSENVDFYVTFDNFAVGQAQ